MKIRHFIWIISLLGGILSFISVLIPTSFNDTTSTLYYVWITQIGVDVEPLAIYLLRTDVTLVMVSWILMLIILTSSIVTITLTIAQIHTSLNFKRLRWIYIVIALLIIASTLFWIYMMEAFYNSAGYHHWVLTGGGYTPYWGIILPFIGAGLIGLGFFSKRKGITNLS
jgi:hypothetical protein